MAIQNSGISENVDSGSVLGVVLVPLPHLNVQILLFCLPADLPPLPHCRLSLSLQSFPSPICFALSSHPRGSKTHVEREGRPKAIWKTE